MTDRIGFTLFLSLWNRVQGQTTPAPHFRIARWLESAWEGGDRRLLLMAFRSCGKSTITGLFAAWLLLRDPDLRILVLAAESILARKMVRNVKRIIEKHPLTPHLKPERLDQWGSDRFTVNRALELRDPSMLARGLSGNITGSRADIIICDDVEVPGTCETAAKRADLREHLAEIEFVLSPGGTQLYVGTPHSWYTIYADAARTEIGETAPFLHGFKRLGVPILENGRSVWPERFPDAEIEAGRMRTGPSKFASQMMLEPVNIADGRLDLAQLVRYGGTPVLSDELKGLYLNGKRLVSASAWWDPAFGTSRGDGSVLAAVFTDEDGARYLHRTAYLNRKAGAPQVEEDKAARQCRLVAEIMRELHLPSVTIETNGIGQFLPNILRVEMARARVPGGVKKAVSTRAKDMRILESFEVAMAARLLHVHDSVYATPFITEMQEWRPGRKGRDDGLDAAAGALSLEPVRLPRLPRVRSGQSWCGAGSVQMADTDFEV
jgi:hypothetical protein